MGTGQVNRFRDNIWLRRGFRAAASGFGAGSLPFAQGTAGSLLSLPLWYWTGGWGQAHFLLLASVLLVSIPAVSEAAVFSGEKDSRSIVIDEVAGMLVAATGIPWGWKNAFGVFLLFRIFDIWKIGPVAWCDRREGPVYVVADDVAAGVCAGLAYRGIAWLIG